MKAMPLWEKGCVVQQCWLGEVHRCAKQTADTTDWLPYSGKQPQIRVRLHWKGAIMGCCLQKCWAA